jgi:hypothetical protein
MITFLWMLYLAFTYLLSIWLVNNMIPNIIYKKGRADKHDIILAMITCILWSIWYFYYLH